MPSDFTPNNVWGQTSPLGTEEELITPSGQTCRARKMSIESMIENGLLADADAATALVSKHIRKVKGQEDSPRVNEAAILGDPKALSQIIGLVDRVLPLVVLSPQVQLHYRTMTVGKTRVQKALTPEERTQIQSEFPGVVFTDQIDLGDKMFLFDWAAGGLQAIAPFRGGSANDLGGVVPRKGAKKSTKRRPRDN